MRTILEIEKELIGLGFKYGSGAPFNRHCYIIWKDTINFMADIGYDYRLRYQNGNFYYFRYHDWNLIEEELSLEAIILLYGNI